MRHFIRMSSLATLVVLASVFPGVARAQSGADVTLQLPSFSSFGVNTSVVVPDRGVSPLARERQAFYERTMYGGPLNQRSLGVTRRTASVEVEAQVHDPRADEAELLREYRERRATWSRNSVVPIGRPQHLAADELPAFGSVADIERERAARIAARAREAKNYLAQARAARDAGKPGVAAVYYGMAASRGDDQWKLQVEAEARKVRAAADATKTAANPR